LLLGLWLLSGWRPGWARGVALATFGVLTVVALTRTIGGESSCGCLGRFSPAPAIMHAIDLAALGVLWRSPLRGAPQAVARRHPLAVTAAAMTLLTVVSSTAVMASFRPAVLTASGDIVGPGGTVVLEPARWVGGRLALLPHIDIGEQLAHGHWLVVFHRAGCPKCGEALAHYERLARELAAAQAASGGREPPETRNRPVRIALVELPAVHDDGEADDRTESLPGCVPGRLRDDVRWFLPVPSEIELRNGRVTRYDPEARAIRPSDLPSTPSAHGRQP
jgi:hypothetical protein